MKISFSFLFYFFFLGVVSFFLWYYLQVPHFFIISLIISLFLIGRMVWQRKKYTAFIGSLLLVIHIIWLAWILIPIYNNTPDIRQRYRRTPSMIRSLLSNSTGMTIIIEHAGKASTLSPSDLTEGQPIYQQDRIITRAPRIIANDRLLLTFWDGSTMQLFPQSTLRIDSLSPRFSSLSGSRIGALIENGIISISTRRTSFSPRDRYIQAGKIYFSCQSCIIAASGSAGSIYSPDSFIWWTASGEYVTLDKGTYRFAGTSISTIQSSPLVSFFSDTTNTTLNRNNQYDLQWDAFASAEWGRSLDTSYLLRELSKRKMMIGSYIDWSYEKKYNNLLLYEYILDHGETLSLPSHFTDQGMIYEFIK